MYKILEGTVGSTAYGLATINSDIDSIGIFLADPKELLSLYQPPQETVTTITPEADSTYHELGKFCRLALKCNPTVTELLWLPEHSLIATAGAGLIDLRFEFLSAKLVRNAYLGYATGQFERLGIRGNRNFSSDTAGRTAKHARHIARLVHQGYELYTTGALTIKLENPEWYHDFGNEVAEGNPKCAEDLLEKYGKMFDDATTPLPTKPNDKLIDEFVFATRVRHIAEYVESSKIGE